MQVVIIPKAPSPMFPHRGLFAAEELLPGLRPDILDAGANRFDTGDLAWLGLLGWNIGRVTVFHVLATSRPLETTRPPQAR